MKKELLESKLKEYITEPVNSEWYPLLKSLLTKYLEKYGYPKWKSDEMLVWKIKKDAIIRLPRSGKGYALILKRIATANKEKEDKQKQYPIFPKFKQIQVTVDKEKIFLFEEEYLKLIRTDKDTREFSQEQMGIFCDLDSLGMLSGKTKYGRILWWNYGEEI